MTTEQHFLHSAFREKLIEHLFVAELLKISWKRSDCLLEIAKPEVDTRGYDLIAEHEELVRHVQLKTTHSLARASGQNVHVALAKKPSGCVIWIVFDSETLQLGPFLFYGGPAGAPLPNMTDMKFAKHTKADMQGVKAVRKDLRRVPKARFKRVENIDDLFEVLFSEPV